MPANPLRHPKNSEQKLNNSAAVNFYYIWHYLEWGGAQVLFFGLMKEAKKKGRVTAIMPAGSHDQLLKFLNNLQIPCKFFNAHTDLKPARGLKRKLERHWNKLRCEFALLRYLKNFDFRNSIIHTELTPWQSLFALWRLCSKAKVFVTLHNALPPVSNWRFRLWQIKFGLLTKLPNFHLFTANRDTKNSLKKFVSKDFFETIKVIYANVNPDEVKQALEDKTDRRKFEKKYDLPENKFLIFCVGQFIDRKGRWVFLEAAGELLKKNNDMAFVWISNSKPAADEILRIKEYNLGENFKLITSDQIGTEHVDLFKLLRLADLFALPSYLEGLPISVIEAMALGIPTISTNVNAIPEAVKHLETGWLIEPGSSQLLTAAVQTLKDDKNLRKKLSVSGQKFALKNFNEKVVAKIAVESYLDAIAEQ